MAEVSDAVLACSTLAYRHLPLADCLARIRALGFTSVELGVFDGFTQLTVGDLVADPDGVATAVAAELERAGVEAIGLNTSVACDGTEAGGAQLAALVRLADAVGATTITFEPPPRGTPVERAAELVAPLVAQAAAAGRTLLAETHRSTITELPADARRLVEMVPGLLLTLDPAHYLAGPGHGEPLNGLYRFVRNLHVRDAGATWDEIQVDFGTGMLELDAILAALAAQGYSGNVVIEYVGEPGEADVAPSVLAAERHVRTAWSAE